MSEQFSSIIHDYEKLSVEDYFDESQKVDGLYARLSSFYENDGRHEYVTVSQLVYNTDDPEVIDMYLQVAKDFLENSTRDNKEEQVRKSFEKLIDHFNLAIAQKEYINDQLSRVGDLNERLSELKRQQDNDYKKRKKDYEELNQQVKKIEDNSSNVYTQFVAILGIFTTIIFASFGGLQILRNVLENIEGVATHKLIVFSSLSMAGIVLLLFILLNGIARLTGKDIRSCRCHTVNGGCPHGIGEKHPTVVVFMIIMLYLFGSGLSGFVIPYHNFLTSGFLVAGVIIFHAAFLSGLCLVYKELRKMKENKPEPVS
ncbi:hypothetical protein [Salimicrobium salexigens]|uniref:Uncharacterized protein n=1 Tax=Salimicrobium salexigens TaxID=908941 RepID=A0ABY1KM58_9BACI|nr:hypothetical protein [Salimicrobium salexigens]SIS49211.1 hypothetical protein SAMN05421758_1023 [Salimicrobium salexigens]